MWIQLTHVRKWMTLREWPMNPISCQLAVSTSVSLFKEIISSVKSCRKSDNGFLLGFWVLYSAWAHCITLEQVHTYSLNHWFVFLRNKWYAECWFAVYTPCNVFITDHSTLMFLFVCCCTCRAGCTVEIIFLAYLFLHDCNKNSPVLC